MGVVIEPLEVGAMYRSGLSKNPFEEVLRVRVLATKDGFVKYLIGGTDIVILIRNKNEHPQTHPRP